MSELEPRALAAKIIQQVVEDNRSLSTALTPDILKSLKPADKAFCKALCFGVLRHYFYLDATCQRLLSKPFKKKQSLVKFLLLIGLYQLRYMNLPPHAAVSATVNAVKPLECVWAKGLVNAVLRNFQRQQTQLTQALANDPQAQSNLPAWLFALIKTGWPDHWSSIVTASQQHPPFWLRHNRRCGQREDYVKQLTQLGIVSEINRYCDDALLLEKPCHVTQLPGFTTGEVSVQDGAAQLAATLLQVNAGDRVLDACAAPGGKLCHVLEIENQLAAMVAIESDANRCDLIHDNLQRLHLSAEVIHADAKQVETWWDGQLFDRILLDAPCSATGVMRRHPDIKFLRQASDFPHLAEQQLQLLNALWPLLKPKGLLLYATCSIMPVENVDVIKTFCAMTNDAKLTSLDLPFALPCDYGYQILPGTENMDGFYYCCLEKIT